MWEKIYENIGNLLTMGVKVERHEKEITEMKMEMRRLSDAVQILLAEYRSVSKTQDSDREYLEVWIEKEMLKMEKRLSSGAKNDEK